jgi:hypothetical protein
LKGGHRSPCRGVGSVLPPPASLSAAVGLNDLVIQPGWMFWIEHSGRVRYFTVGVENEDAAKLTIQTQFPDVNFLNFISKQRAPADLIKMLGLTGGKGMEWAAGNPRDAITPQGVDIGSDYDPLRKK